MTYIDLMNSFLDSSEYVHLSPNAQALYVRLFYINNKCGWAKWFGASDRRLMELTCIDSKNSFTRAKKQLQEYGYIEIKTEPKKTTRYHLIDITKKQPTNF